MLSEFSITIPVLLAPHHAPGIHRLEFEPGPFDSEEHPGRNKTTQALYFVYANKDTTGDGEITQGDRSKIGLSKANGEGFTTVLSDIDHGYSVSLIGDRLISILYRVGKSLRQARYSVGTLGKEFDREVVAIPGVEYRG